MAKHARHDRADAPRNQTQTSRTQDPRYQAPGNQNRAGNNKRTPVRRANAQASSPEVRQYSRYGGNYGTQPAKNPPNRDSAYGTQPPVSTSNRGGFRSSHPAYTYPPTSSKQANIPPYTNAPRQANKPQQAYAQPFQSAPRDFAMPQQSARKPKKSSALKTILGVLGAILLICAVALGIFVAIINNNMSFGDKQAEIKAALTPAELGQPFYVLVLGSDARENPEYINDTHGASGERADVILLLRVDEKNKVISMLSIPRDTPWTASDGSIHKINEAYTLGGVAGTIKAVEQVTGAKINHVAETHLSEFEALIDTLGGITVNVPIEMSYKNTLSGETITLHPGVQTINGEQAQILARARKQYSGNQDENRQSAVRMIVSGILDKVKKTPITKLPSTVQAATNCVKTDMGVVNLLWLAFNMRSGVAVYSGTGPNDGEQVPEVGGLWLCYDDKEGWARVMQVMNAGQDIGKVSYKGDTAKVPGTNRTVTIE